MSSIWTTCFVEAARPRAVSGGGRRRSSRLRASAYAGGALCNATARNASPSRSQSVPNLASQIRVAFSSIAWNTGSSSPGELEITLSTSEVAVCCCNDSRSSLSRRTFSMAMTACLAKLLTNSICFSVNGRTSWRYIAIIPMNSFSLSMGTASTVRAPVISANATTVCSRSR